MIRTATTPFLAPGLSGYRGYTLETHPGGWTRVSQGDDNLGIYQTPRVHGLIDAWLIAP